MFFILCIYRGASSGHRTPQLPPFVVVCCACCCLNDELKSAAERSLCQLNTEEVNLNEHTTPRARTRKRNTASFGQTSPVALIRSRPKYEVRHTPLTEVIHSVSVFINCPTVSPMGHPIKKTALSTRAKPLVFPRA